MGRALVQGIASVAALGGFVAGIDSGIIATTLGQDSFKLYMYGPSRADSVLSGTIVAVYNAGQAVGSLCAGYLADRISRKYAIALASILSVVGSAIQTGSVNPGMLIAGRLLAGMACGGLFTVVPVYLAEIAPPSQRGFLVGLQGMAMAIGYGTANWIGYGGSFAAAPEAQWRIPLAMQIPQGIVLGIGVLFVPFTPRWLVQQDRADEAAAVLARLHGTESGDLVDQELIQIRAQIGLEKAQGDVSWMAAMVRLFSPRYIRRTATSTFVLAMSQLSGSNAIQNFQSTFYATAGFVGRQSLLISGIYGMMGIIGQVVYLVFVADRWPRTRTMWTGSLTLASFLALCMALSAVYGQADGNLAGARGAIAAIFLYSATFAVFFNAMVWVVSSELFPFFLRSKGMSFVVFVKAIVAIVLSQITPVALAAVSWRYYALFIATNVAAAGIYFFFLPETRGKSLEEIAELFGDTLATSHIGEIDVEAKRDAIGLERVERAERV